MFMEEICGLSFSRLLSLEAYLFVGIVSITAGVGDPFFFFFPHLTLAMRLDIRSCVSFFVGPSFPLGSNGVRAKREWECGESSGTIEWYSTR